MTENEIEMRYGDAARVLGELLDAQSVLIGGVKLIAENNRVNAKALGYIYGFTDCALQIAKLDILSAQGMGVLLFLITEFDERNADRLFDYLKAPSDEAAFMDGVRIGGNDYNEWVRSRGKATPIRWAKCF